MQSSNDKVQINAKLSNFGIRKLIISFIICIFAYLLISYSAFAQTGPGLDLTISPPVIELNVNPGDKIKDKFKVRNNLTNAVGLSVDVKKLSSDSISGEPVPAEPTASDEFVSWIKVDSSNFSVLPKEWKEVNFSIDVPTNAAYGYYYVLRITPTGDIKLNGSGAKVNGEVLVVILLNVKKDGAIAKGKITEFKPSTFIGEYLPVDFSIKVKNEGNVHIKPTGNIFIRSFHQKDIDLLTVNGGRATVLPGGSRTFTASWGKGFLVKVPVVEGDKPKLDKNGNIVTKLQINWDHLTEFRFGKYTASMLLVYDSGKRDETLEAVTTFWLIPYTAIGIIFVSLVILIILIRFLLRWYISRELRKQRK